MTSDSDQIAHLRGGFLQIRQHAVEIVHADPACRSVNGDGSSQLTLCISYRHGNRDQTRDEFLTIFRVTCSVRLIQTFA